MPVELKADTSFRGLIAAAAPVPPADVYLSIKKSGRVEVAKDDDVENEKPNDDDDNRECALRKLFLGARRN